MAATGTAIRLQSFDISKLKSTMKAANIANTEIRDFLVGF